MMVREVLFGSFRLLKERPVFLLPTIILAALSYAVLGLIVLAFFSVYGPGISLVQLIPPVPLVFILGTLMGTLSSWYLPAIFVSSIIFLVVSPLISGMYPSMVRDHMEKRELSLRNSLRFSYHKFWSLFCAFLPVVLATVAIVLAITISLASLLLHTQHPAVMIGTMITGMIVGPLIGVFFYYIHPAIIMDDMKAVAGFRRSFKVAKKNYPFTLSIFLIPAAISFAVYRIFIGLPLCLGAVSYICILSLILGSISALVITVWAEIMIAYAYYNMRT